MALSDADDHEILPDIPPSPVYILEPPPPQIVEAIKKQVLERERQADIDEKSASHRAECVRKNLVLWTARPEPMPAAKRRALEARYAEIETKKRAKLAEEEKLAKGKSDTVESLQERLEYLQDLRRRVKDLIERRKTYAEKCAERAAREEAERLEMLVADKESQAAATRVGAPAPADVNMSALAPVVRSCQVDANKLIKPEETFIPAAFG